MNPHEARFEQFEALPHINSKYKTPFKGMEIKKNMGRNDDAKNAGHYVILDNPSNPAKTNYYDPDVPKFYKGQPGFK